MISDAPSLIIATFLEAEGVFKRPGSGTTVWPLFVNYSPDDDTQGLVPDDIGVVYDTPGRKDGRLMEGPYVFHPGISIRIRSTDQTDGWDKIIEASKALELLTNKEVLVRSGCYTIKNISATGPALFLGLEEGTKRRFLFTQNFLVTITEA
jgi:hypothetical protein